MTFGVAHRPVEPADVPPRVVGRRPGLLQNRRDRGTRPAADMSDGVDQYRLPHTGEPSNGTKAIASYPTFKPATPFVGRLLT